MATERDKIKKNVEENTRSIIELGKDRTYTKEGLDRILKIVDKIPEYFKELREEIVKRYATKAEVRTVRRRVRKLEGIWSKFDHVGC